MIECEYCPKEYQTHAGLNYHVKVEHEEELEHTCPSCPEEFRTKQGMKRHHYEMHGESIAYKECIICDDEFYPSHSGAHLCSESCQGEYQSGENNNNWNGGTADEYVYYGSSWNEELKEEVRERDDRECQVCGYETSSKEGNLSVHHITRFKEFGLENHIEANKKSNLIALCRSCHSSVETGMIECPEVNNG